MCVVTAMRNSARLHQRRIIHPGSCNNAPQNVITAVGMEIRITFDRLFILLTHSFPKQSLPARPSGRRRALMGASETIGGVDATQRSVTVLQKNPK